MAKRHEDRKPGQRFARGDSRGGRGAPQGRGATGRGGPGRGGPGRGGPGRGGPGRGGQGRGTQGRGEPGRGDPEAERRGAPPQDRRPAPRRSSRREQGLIVTPSAPPGTGVGDGKVRLNHFLAMSGVCSRRAADGLITGGRIEVNGELVTTLGTRVDPERDEVCYDGSRVQPEKPVYVLFNKPTGVVCTNAKHEQKKRVIDFLPQVRGRLFTVGRLDMDSEGLILLTNDGSFALEMTHPRFGVPKLYSVLVQGRIEQSDLGKARGGIWLAEGPTAGMDVKVERVGKDHTFLKITLREGKNREIRRVFAKLGHRVTELKRVRIGGLTLHGLSRGKWRFLQAHEVQKLREMARSPDRPLREDEGEN